MATTQPAKPGPPTGGAAKRKCRTYRVGETTSTGQVVKTIMATSEKCFIYLDEEGELGCEFEETRCVDGDLTVREAMDLYQEMDAMGFSPRQKRRAVGLLASGLSHALEDRRVGDRRDFFREARSFIRTRIVEQFQFTYLFAAVLTALLICVLTYFAFCCLSLGTYGEYVKVFAFGTGGALLSVLMRFRAPIDGRYASKRAMVAEGIVRMSLGGCFGTLFLLLHKAGLLMSIADTSPEAIASLAVVAGFSERLIPGVMESLAGRLSKIDEDGEDEGRHEGKKEPDDPPEDPEGDNTAG